MISVRLKNPSIALVPISDLERESMEKRLFGDERLYVLYELPNYDGIHIGMLSESARRYTPDLANVGNLEYATSMAYFYNGGSQLLEDADEINDRPVYLVSPTDDRRVASYSLSNADKNVALSIRLEDVVNGEYTVVDKEKAAEFKKIK